MAKKAKKVVKKKVVKKKTKKTVEKREDLTLEKLIDVKFTVANNRITVLEQRIDRIVYAISHAKKVKGL